MGTPWLHLYMHHHHHAHHHHHKHHQYHVHHHHHMSHHHLMHIHQTSRKHHIILVEKHINQAQNWALGDEEATDIAPVTAADVRNLECNCRTCRKPISEFRAGGYGYRFIRVVITERRKHRDMLASYSNDYKSHLIRQKCTAELKYKQTVQWIRQRETGDGHA